MRKSSVRAAAGPLMTLANTRENGVRAVIATCEARGHKAVVNVDAPPASTAVLFVARRMRCSQCGGKKINTRPAWHTRSLPGMAE